MMRCIYLLFILCLFGCSGKQKSKHVENPSTTQQNDLDTALISYGRTLYLNCSSCHHLDRDATGPSLLGIHRRRSFEWIKRFIINSQKMIKEGDKEATKIYNKWNQIAMNSFPDFQDKEIKAILEYLKYEENKRKKR